MLRKTKLLLVSTAVHAANSHLVDCPPRLMRQQCHHKPCLAPHFLLRQIPGPCDYCDYAQRAQHFIETNPLLPKIISSGCSFTGLLQHGLGCGSCRCKTLLHGYAMLRYGPKYIFDAGFILLAQQLDIAFKLACNRGVLYQAEEFCIYLGWAFSIA